MSNHVLLTMSSDDYNLIKNNRYETFEKYLSYRWFQHRTYREWFLVAHENIVVHGKS